MNIILTSVGRRTYMVEYFKKALGGNGLVYASNSIDTYTLHQADDYVITPQIYDDNYVAFLLSYCKKHSISALISLFDIDLPILSRNKSLFEQAGIRLVISDYPVTQICNDKWQTYQFLSAIGIRQTPTFINLSEAKSALANGKLSFPLFIKPRWGMGSIGIYKIETDVELDVLYTKLHRDIFRTYLKFESSIDKNECILIQQAIQGQEYGVEIFNDLNGNYVSTFAKKKISMRAGETDIAETIDAEPFMMIAKQISKELRHIANLDVDCFVEEDGNICVLEMNCRFGGQYPFTHNAGVDEPKQIIKWLEGNPTDFSLLQQINGVRSCKELHPVIFCSSTLNQST